MGRKNAAQDNGAPAGSTSPPAVITRGRFALYAAPDGGAVLSWRPEGAGTDMHIPVPAVAWQLMQAAARGERITPAMIMRAARGLGG